MTKQERPKLQPFPGGLPPPTPGGRLHCVLQEDGSLKSCDADALLQPTLLRRTSSNQELPGEATHRTETLGVSYSHRQPPAIPTTSLLPQDISKPRADRSHVPEAPSHILWL